MHLVGLEVIGAAGFGISVTGHHNTVERCRAHANQNTGIDVGAPASYALVVLTAPLFGAIMDFSGSKKRFLMASWLLTVIATAALQGVPAPCMGSALSYYDGYRSEKLPANLLQGQRDFFGAHTYERTDHPRGKFFHIDWPEADRPQLEM